MKLLPGKTEPTVGIEDHTQESIDFWQTFPDQRLMYDLVTFMKQIGLGE